MTRPTPNVIKLLHGNPSGREINRDAPEPKKIKAPKCPSILKGTARREWKWITRHLVDMGLIGECDKAVLSAYCTAWARFVEAEEHLAKESTLVVIRRYDEKGNEIAPYTQQSPWVSISNKSLQMLVRHAVELGLSPSARSQLIAKRKGKGAGADPLGILD